MPMLLVEHDMEAVFKLADRISVLAYGRIVATGTPDEVRADEQAPCCLSRERRGMSLLEVSGLESGYGLSQVLFGVELKIDQGEAATLLGRNGMGKTTTVRSIMGLFKPMSGSIRFNSREITAAPPFRVGQAGIGLVPEGRQDLSDPVGGRKPARLCPFSRRLGSVQGLRVLSAARRKKRQSRLAAFRRRAADAGDRQGADDQPVAADPG